MGCDNMIIEIKNNINPGFYESIIDPLSNGLEDDELEEINEQFLKNEDITIEYDYKEYQFLTSSAINNYLIETINDIARNYMNIDELFKNKCEEEVLSPKFYNYETDRAFFKVSCDRYDFESFINQVFDRWYNELDQMILDNHTSCDGFISFYSNDINNWYLRRFKLDYNELGTILEAIIKWFKSEETIMYDMMEVTNDTWYKIDHWLESGKDGSKYDYHQLLELNLVEV
jgi:hypothetical protein